MPRLEIKNKKKTEKIYCDNNKLFYSTLKVIWISQNILLNDKGAIPLILTKDFFGLEINFDECAGVYMMTLTQITTWD